MLKYFHKYYPIRKLVYYLLEGCLIFSGLYLTHYFINYYLLLDIDIDSDYPIWLRVLLITIIVQICLYYHELYEFKSVYRTREVLYKIGHALSISCIILGLCYFLYPQLALNTGIFFLSIFLIIFVLISWRLFYQYLCLKGYFKEKVFLIGSGNLARSIVKLVSKNLDSGVNIAAICSNPENSGLSVEYNLPEIHDYSQICDKALNQGVKKIVVALEEKRGAIPLKDLLACRLKGIKILDGIYFHELLSGKIVASQTPPSWLIFSEGFNRQWLGIVCKRIVDIIFSFLGLILLSPLFLLIAIAIKLDSKGPVFFKQYRVGSWDKHFEVIKFRSMREEAEEGTGAVWAASDDERITRVGRVLRKLRLDELPQFWNILKAEMSFIGPRPERPEFVEILKERLPYYGERHSVKPGLSGWAQVNYGYGASEEDALKKLEYELFYIKHLSIIFDFYIVFKTIKIVLFGKGR